MRVRTQICGWVNSCHHLPNGTLWESSTFSQVLGRLRTNAFYILHISNRQGNKKLIEALLNSLRVTLIDIASVVVYSTLRNHTILRHREVCLHCGGKCRHHHH